MTWLDSVWPPCLIMGVCVAASLWELIRGWDVPNSSKEQRRKLQGLWKPNLESYTAWLPLHSTGQNESQGQLRFQGEGTSTPHGEGSQAGRKVGRPLANNFLQFASWLQNTTLLMCAECPQSLPRPPKSHAILDWDSKSKISSSKEAQMYIKLLRCDSSIETPQM